MVANVKTNIQPQETTPQYRTWFENYSRSTIVWLGLFLYTLSTKLLHLVDHQIATSAATPATPYTGPTYGKMANATRKIISGKIAHEKGYTPSTGWLYAVIAGLIDRRSNTLEITLVQLMLETGLGKNSLIDHTKYLEMLGLLFVDRSKSGPKSSEINVYSLMGEGAEVVLWNGTKRKPHAILRFEKQTSDVWKPNSKDSLQTNPNKQAAAVVKKENHAPEEIELSPQQQAAVNALKDVKISAKVARTLVIDYKDNNNMERLFATIKCAQVSSSIKNPAGFIRDELQNNKQNLSWDIVNDGWQTLGDYIKRYTPKSPEDYEAPAKPEAKTIPVLYNKPAGPEQRPLPEVDPQVKEQWTIAYNQLELQFDRATFATWLRGAQVVGQDDDVFVIAVRDSYVRDMLQHRLYRNIRRVLSDVCARPIEIRFVVRKLAKEKNDGSEMPLFKILAQQQESNYE